MKDRISKYPGRVKLIPVGGAENTYTVTRADEPEDEGTPLNKATLLSDLTAAEIGLTEDVPTVNGALYKLITLINAIANNYTKIRFAAAAPTISTEGKVGDMYIDTTNPESIEVYICVAESGTGTNWSKLTSEKRVLKTDIITDRKSTRLNSSH